MSKKMPDLFVVMSSDELVEAVSFAKEQGAVNARVFEDIDVKNVLELTQKKNISSVIK